MVRYKEILKSFGMSRSNEEIIRRIGVLMLPERDNFVTAFLQQVFSISDMPETVRRNITSNYQAYIERWYDNFMLARVDNGIVNFFMTFNAQETPANYYSDERIACLFGFIREWMQEKVYEHAETEREYAEAFKAFAKLIDISAYLVNHDYTLHRVGKNREFKAKDYVLRFSDQFSFVMHTVLVAFLVVMTVGATGYFVYEFTILRGVEPDRLFITALGSLLVVWVLVELLHSEIQMLRGDRFKISIFVGVALIAFIRDLLIMTLKHDSNLQSTMLLIGGVFVLGVTYWLLSGAEREK